VDGLELAHDDGRAPVHEHAAAPAAVQQGKALPVVVQPVGRPERVIDRLPRAALASDALGQIAEVGVLEHLARLKREVDPAAHAPALAVGEGRDVGVGDDERMAVSSARWLLHAASVSRRHRLARQVAPSAARNLLGGRVVDGNGVGEAVVVVGRKRAPEPAGAEVVYPLLHEEDGLADALES
jgi:hypothetical protein